MRVLYLVMQATQHTLAGFSVVVLNEVHFQAGGMLELSLVENLEEASPIVYEDFFIKYRYADC